MFRPRFVVLLPVVTALVTTFSASADPLSDLRAVLQRYPAKARFAASASLRVSGQSADAGARSGAAKFEVELDSRGMVLRTPPATLTAAAREAERKKHDADSPTPTRNAMVAVTIFDVIDALDVAAMLLNDLEGATIIDSTESSLAGKPVTLLRIKAKPDLAGARSKLVNEPVIELRVWLNRDGIPVAAERDSTYSASVLFVTAANVRKERWEIAVAGDRLYATRADQSNRASAAGKTLASSRSVTYEVTR
ncbi:MAG: hypothetical protein ACXW5U_05445 [Thermoanaerobaculia bacterium]